MAYFSLHAYDADLWIPEFKGLSQSDILMNPDVRMAAEAENLETPSGVLQPMADCPLSIGEFDNRVETLAGFHRRWYAGTGGIDWYVCCVNGKFYQRQAGTKIDWAEIQLPMDVGGAFNKSVWSWVTYEIHPEESQDTVDVLLMSNEEDGMIMIIPPDRPTTWGDIKEFTWEYVMDMTWLQVTSKDWHIVHVDTKGYKFGVIERYGERIWGGSVADFPDKLVYSAPYDPTDWEANEEIPEDGAGDIDQPSWDGDKFYALRRFGDHLLAFKKNRIWRVVGLSPGEYTFQEQFGGGTEYFNTIAVDNERVFMLTADGMNVYDGMSTSPFTRKSVELIWNTANRSALDQACGCLYKNRYYLSFPINGSTTNNALLVYNFDENTILYYKGLCIEAMMPMDAELLATSSTLPGRILQINYDSWTIGKASGAPTRWVSPWIDMGYKKIVKGGFELYFMPEVQDKKVTFTISIQTEKKTKSKKYTVYPLNVVNPNPDTWRFIGGDTWTYPFNRTWGQIGGKVDEVVKQFKHKKLHFSGAGRRFRVIIETENGVTAPWRLVGGLHLVIETDPD